MRHLLYILIIISNYNCSQKGVQPLLRIVTIDQSNAVLHSGDSVLQVLTNHGLRYLNTEHIPVDSCFYNNRPCTRPFFDVTAYDLYYVNDKHAIYLLEEIYDPYDDSELYLKDTLFLSEQLENVFFINVNYHQASSTVQVHKPNNPPILSHLIAHTEDQIIYKTLDVEHDQIIVIDEYELTADSIVFSLHRHHSDPIIYQHQDQYGLLGIHNKPNFKMIEPFEYNYSRAQHHSGVWGYLKSDGTWFPDE